MLSQRSQTQEYVLYDSIYTMYMCIQNQSVLFEVRMEAISEGGWQEISFVIAGNILILNLGAGYMDMPNSWKCM